MTNATTSRGIRNYTLAAMGALLRVKRAVPVSKLIVRFTFLFMISSTLICAKAEVVGGNDIHIIRSGDEDVSGRLAVYEETPVFQTKRPTKANLPDEWIIRSIDKATDSWSLREIQLAGSRQRKPLRLCYRLQGEDNSVQMEATPVTEKDHQSFRWRVTTIKRHHYTIQAMDGPFKDWYLDCADEADSKGVEKFGRKLVLIEKPVTVKEWTIHVIAK